jgi:hypothetical protein
MDVPDAKSSSVPSPTPAISTVPPPLFRPVRLTRLDTSRANTLAVVATLGTGVVLGLLTDLLFNSVPMPGINVFLWIAALIVGVVGVTKLTGQRVTTRALLCAGASLLFAACIAWRSSPALTFLNLCLVLFWGGLAAAPAFGRRFVHPTIAHCTQAANQFLRNLFCGFPKLAGEIPWGFLRSFAALREVSAAARGLLIALPLCTLFAILFAHADENFAAVARAVLQIPDNIVAHVFCFAAGLWVSCGIIRMAALVATPEQAVADRPEDRLQLSVTDCVFILVPLNLLFATFVALQLPYLFGGMHHVFALPGLTLAQYARHGFFELAIVASLVLPLLLAADWLLEKTATACGRQTFRVLCFVLIGLVAVIMASAFQRMWLYMRSYGLTELRLYVSAFMVMLTLLFGWFAATVLRGRRELFLAGALIIGGVCAFALQWINPDKRIAQYNLARCADGGACDMAYVLHLSPDAWPEIASQLRNKPLPEATTRLMQLSDRAKGLNAQPWQSWNYGRAIAAKNLVP